MHSVSHSLVHRGAAASAPRWQPYASTSTSTQSYQNWTPTTPATHLSNSPSTSRRVLAAGANTNPSLPEPPSSYRPPLGRMASARDVQKSRYIAALVDQAVKSLGEIWQPEDIPVEFTSIASSRSSIPTQTTSMPNIGSGPCSVTGASSSLRPSLYHCNTQLPSPVTPSTQPFPVPPRSQHAQAVLAATESSPSTTAPLRSFVLEVLKRSKTSAGVLQTALCYITAIAHKVPVLAAQERMGLAGRGEPSMENFITNGWQQEDSLQRDPARDDASAPSDAEQQFHDSHMSSQLPLQSDTMDEDAGMLAKTVKVDDDFELPATPESPLMDSNVPRAALQPQPVQQRYIPGRPPGPSVSLPPLPALPNPLLCPRRTFLAAVILASKFTQDKCFSNKAWARLAGLPAREISRCERALGAALDWRLWVGKLPSVPASLAPASADAALKVLGRTKTIGDLNSTSIMPRARRSGVGRSRTLPANSFGEQGFVANATHDPLQWSVAQDAARIPEAPCPEFPLSTSVGKGPFLGGLTMHASPATMSTPGLSYSPASTSSADPTPVILMVDSDAPAHSPAVAIDGPWGLGGALSGVASGIPVDLAHIGGMRMDKQRPAGFVLGNLMGMDVSSYPHSRAA